MRLHVLAAGLASLMFLFSAACGAQGSFDLGTGQLTIDSRGYPSLTLLDLPEPWPAGTEPFVQLDTGGPLLSPETVTVSENSLAAGFANGATCEFAVRVDKGMILFDLVKADIPDGTKRIKLLSLPLPPKTEVMSTLNAGRTATHIVALQACEPNVCAYQRSTSRHDSDRAGCSHEFAPSSEAKEGNTAVRFTATSDANPGGWSVSGRSFPQPLDLTGCKAIRAWVHGDAQGQQLKIQLADGIGGYRDLYIPISFDGWQHITTEEAPFNTLRYDHVAALALYYNGLPPGKTVTCLVDHIEAIVVRDGVEQTVLLDDFESPGSPFWSESTHTINVETLASHGLLPARFGLVVAPHDAFLDTMQRFEVAAGLPSPRPGGVWNKQSPWIKRSYLFITNFSEPQFDDVLAMARRGGFDMILILQSSWARATGHYEINTNNFPGGLESLAHTIQRFKQEGFHVGLHFLGPSIYPPDPYLTPVPDPRLFKDAFAELASGIDASATFIPTTAPPDQFPEEDGGYDGDGAVLQIGDEIILYTSRSTEAPFGFSGCQRGVLGASAAPHAKGERIAHLKKSYGYFLFDMDTTLLDEVSTNFANVANACDIDMIYFDGSERLQGDHWYYNAKLHKAFFDKLQRKDILLQASSFSHYSWHILARSASADGHGDIKGYLDERSGWLDAFKRNAMPLDIGWYYGYDPNATPDMFEYVLGATIGYDSSMSFQVSLDAASRHPFTGDILDLISRYERLRLSGRVPEDMRARLRIDPALAGVMTPEERARLLDLRRDYRLLGADGSEAFQRVIYSPWHEVTPADQASISWSLTVKDAPARVGVQFHALPGPWLAPGPSYYSADAVLLEAFDDLAPFLSNPAGRQQVTSLAQSDGGATLEGVTQHIEIITQDAREGGTCAVYTAESARASNDGWSVVGKAFDPPLDLSGHRALGFWLRGDGNGGAFKLQLRDGAKAADFYIQNTYTGWQYHQLPRPEPDPIDYTQVRALALYYNGLPAATTVTCAIDDVKALPGVDERILNNPWLSIGENRFLYEGALEEGQYAFLWPGEPWRRYGAALNGPEPGGGASAEVSLEKGEYAIQFGCSDTLLSPVRMRVTLQPPERHAVP